MIKGGKKWVCYTREKCAPLIPRVYDLAYGDGFSPRLTPEIVQQDFVKKIDMTALPDHVKKIAQFKKFGDPVDTLGRLLNFNDIQENTRSVEDWGKRPPRVQRMHEAHITQYVDLVRAYILRDAPALLHALNKIFDYVVEIDFTEAAAEKIKYLENFLQTAPLYPAEFKQEESEERQLGQRPPKALPLYELLQPFLYEFNYHQLLLNNFPTLRPLPETGPPKYVYDTRQDIVNLKITAPPQVGDVPPQTFNLPPGVKACYPVRPFSKMYYWYEDTLRQVFKELNLAYKRTPLVSNKTIKKYAEAYGWEIVTPPAELATRLFITL